MRREPDSALMGDVGCDHLAEDFKFYWLLKFWKKHQKSECLFFYYYFEGETLLTCYFMATLKFYQEEKEAAQLRVSTVNTK